MSVYLIFESPVVFRHLRSLGCCKRCCLRYLGERNAWSYVNVEEFIKKEQLDLERDCGMEPEHKMLKENPCIVCLGLLQYESSIDQTANKIIAEIVEASYDCDIFSCALSLPISFQLRDHSLWLHLVDKFSLPTHNQEKYVVSVKEVWKLTVGPLISKAIKKELDSGIKSEFFVGVNIMYPGDEEECACLLEMHADKFKIREKQKRKYHGTLYTRKAVDIALQSTEADHFKQFFPSPPDVPVSSASCDSVICTHNSIFMAGRYNKFSRSLSQSPWVIDGERRMESSVQEIICEHLQKAGTAEGYKFLASGREDVDVRTLGKGRPFACELLNPHKVKHTLEEIRNLEADINTSNKTVFVRDLQLVHKNEMMKLKDGEENKKKRYMALCISHDPIDPHCLDKLETIKDLKLNQKTPIRVLHRRPLAIRPRIVHSMKVWPINNSTKSCRKGGVIFKLDLQTQAGTYIKEFVHGDFGRTQPNLGQLLGGVSVDILALDVEEIVLDWPPSLNYAQE